MPAPFQKQEFLEALFPEKDVKPDFRKKLFEIFKHDPEFPSFPAAVAKLQEKLSRPDTTFEEIAEIVRLDPGLTGRVYTLVRSAAFAGIEVSSIEDALFRIGLRETRALLLTSKILDRFAHLRVAIDWNRFWVHSIVTARLTAAISDTFRYLAYKPYISGLLHDIGKVILAHYFPELFEMILQQARHDHAPMFKVERQQLGTDHAAIGVALGNVWGLNEDVLNAILFHHAPEQQFLTHCLNVANIVANRYAENIYEETPMVFPPTAPPLAESATPEPPPMTLITAIPEWQQFTHLSPMRLPDTIIEQECSKARETVQSMLETYRR